MIEVEDYLIKDYEIKVRYLSDHYIRSWQRFYFLSTANSLLFVNSFSKDTNPCFAMNQQFIVIVAGFLFSYFWRSLGRTDNHLATLYRRQVEYAHYLLMLALRNRIDDQSLALDSVERKNLGILSRHYIHSKSLESHLNSSKEILSFSHAGDNNHNNNYDIFHDEPCQIEVKNTDGKYRVTKFATQFSYIFAFVWALRFFIFVFQYRQFYRVP